MKLMVPDLKVFKDSQYFQNSYANNASIIWVIKVMPNEFNTFGIENLENLENHEHFNQKKNSRWLTSQKLLFQDCK